MSARRREQPAPVPADDSIEPALTTPRRFAGELERLALDLARGQHRLRRLAPYVDCSRFGDLAGDLATIVDQLGTLAGRVLVGELPIVAGRDEAAGRDRYPLLAAIEAPREPASWHDIPVEDLELPDWVSGPLIARGYQRAGQLVPFADGCDLGIEATFKSSWGGRQGKRALTYVRKALEEAKARSANP
jgi:hypothetical protein